MVSNTIREYGDQALLLECTSTEEVLALCVILREARLPGVTDIVPASAVSIPAIPRAGGGSSDVPRRCCGTSIARNPLCSYPECGCGSARSEETP